jgi:hypothetical protein
VVAASEYRALQQQVRELQRLLGKKTVENEILREALDLAQPKKGCRAHPHPVGEIHHEDGRRHARGGALQPGRGGGGGIVLASRPAAAAGNGLAGRDAGTPTYGYRRVHVMVLTKASAMRFDCGLSSGVVQGRKPMLWASLQVSAAR